MSTSPRGLPIPPEWERDPIQFEPEEEPIPDNHPAIDGCGDHPHDECTACIYETESVEAVPCCACWNGNGNGDWCYFERAK